MLPTLLVDLITFTFSMTVSPSSPSLASRFVCRSCTSRSQAATLLTRQAQRPCRKSSQPPAQPATASMRQNGR